VIVSYLPDAETHRLWPAISGLLKLAAPFSNQLIWIAHREGTIHAAALTVLYEDRTAELLRAAGQRHRDWAPQLSETVSAWAKSAGAKKLTMKGRRGWARYAHALGWVTLGKDGNDTIYEKDLR